MYLNTNTRLIRVLYQHDDDGWWAESPDVPGFTAVGQTEDEVRDQALAGVRVFEPGDAPIAIVEVGTAFAEGALACNGVLTHTEASTMTWTLTSSVLVGATAAHAETWTTRGTVIPGRVGAHWDVVPAREVRSHFTELAEAAG